ncbi:MAG: 30S ribosomal protein S2 [Candidatus Diapherotrites archaeon]|nr:30S ribosomal protein S2 [Candidatus Micrarchaeota archaeon]MBU1939317.1 30S ribosomal protein S2 [Candidatus Micrarchaeota archaeon]
MTEEKKVKTSVKGQVPAKADEVPSVKKEKEGVQTVEKKEAKQDDDYVKPAGGVDTLIDVDTYLKTGAHIGTKFKSGDMRKYIYKVRRDGLNVLDVQVLDSRIRTAAQFIAQFEPDKIIAVSKKLYGREPVRQFAEAIGAKAITGRFVPGLFTNPAGKKFIEPGVVIVTEPEPDVQAISEATRIKIPVVALASTNNTLRNIDIAIPINNKGRKSLALVYWLLAREYLKIRGTIKADAEFKKTVDDFEYKMKEGEREEEMAARAQARRGKGDRDDRRGGFGRDSDRGGFGRDRGGGGGYGGRGRERY